MQRGHSFRLHARSAEAPTLLTPTPRLCSHTFRLSVPPPLLAGLERFKQMVREDYYMAEALWAAAACRDGRIDR